MKRVFFQFIIFVLMIAFANASVIYNSDSVASQYSKGDRITGILNLTLNGENIDSVVRTNFGQEITLKDLLDVSGLSVNYDYNCTSYNCLPRYARGQPIASTSLSGKKLIGFSIQGSNIENIQEIRLNLQSSNAASCFQEILLDVLDKEERFLGSSRYTLDSSCYGPRYGCFEIGRNDYQFATIPADIEYCEKITLPPAPAFRLGAGVTNATQGNAVLKMKLYDMNVSLLGECSLPSMTAQSQSIACTLPYSSTVQRDYLVCIKASSQSNYKMKIETNSPCGTSDFGNNYAADYEIFAKNLKFDSPRIELNEGSFLNFTGESLNDYISSFINDNYDNYCSPYCTIPFEIVGDSQALTFSDAHISYRSSAGQLESNNLYSLSKESSSASSGQIRLNLALANFTIPEDAIENRLVIDIGDNRILDKAIILSKGFDFDLQPRFAAFGIDTEFYLTTGENFTQVQWNFGDSSPQFNGGKTATHKYVSQGQYTIEVQARRADNTLSTKRFDITVGDPKTSANSTLKNYRESLSRLDENITALPIWMREEIKGGLNYDEMNNSLRELELDYNSASNNSQYIDIINRLAQFKIPSGIITEAEGKLPLSLGIENIDVKAIEEISNSDVDDEALIESIAEFMSENYDSTIEFQRLGADYRNSVEPLATKFRIETKPRSSGAGHYLILGYPREQIITSQDYGAKEIEGATYFSLDENENFEFVILDGINAEELGAYISPLIEELEISGQGCDFDNVCEEGEENCEDCKKSRIWIWVAVVGLLGVAGFFLARRYGKKKAKFKNPRDLINLTSFISNARSKGMSEGVIIEKLKAAGWTEKQIKYAFSVVKKERKVY